jgi:hypothetical protein
MKAIIVKCQGEYYVENNNPEVLALTKSLLGTTMFRSKKSVKHVIRKLQSFDLDYNLVSLEITPL